MNLTDSVWLFGGFILDPAKVNLLQLEEYLLSYSGWPLML